MIEIKSENVVECGQCEAYTFILQFTETGVIYSCSECGFTEASN